MRPRKGSGVRVFPLPAIALPRPTASHSPRVRQRYNRNLSCMLLANRCVSALNRLHFSFSSTPPLFSKFISRTTSRLVDNVIDLCRRVCVSRQANLSLSDLDSCENHFPYANLASERIPLQADKVSLPSAAGTVPLLSLLPDSLALVYADPQCLLRPSAPPGRRPRPAFGASTQEYLKLLRRMMPLGMLAFTTEPKKVNGLFATAKPDGSQRLIIDARPGNVSFVDSPPVQLPTPDVTARLSIPPGETLYVAKVDLDNFYHRLLLPEWMQPYFALPGVASELLGLPGPNRVVYPCCRTLPMGWSHSVYVAQAAHEHWIQTMVGFPVSDRLTATSDSRLDRTRHQVYIDDLLLFGLSKEEVATHQQKYLTAASAVGLPPKRSKLVLPTSDPVECLGLEVDGKRHTIGLAPSKLALLSQATADLLWRGECTGLELAHLLGKWTWAAMACRPALAVLSSVYTFVQKAGCRLFQLWPTVRRELVTMMDLAPLLLSSLTDEWCSRAVAVDASTTGLGVVSTRFCTDNFEDYGDPAAWNVVVSSRWRFATEHINSYELRAVSTAVRWSLSYPSSTGRKLLIFSDSLVAVGSLRKGRSSSPLLLRRLRTISSWLLAGGLRLLLYWIPSELNPADEPSRR